MPRSESLDEFVKNMPKFAPIVLKKGIESWNKNTLLTLAEAQRNAPVKTGALRDSGARLKARITSKGIRSAITFPMIGKRITVQTDDGPVTRKINFPYPKQLEIGVTKSGKAINVNTSINPRARTGYVAKAIDDKFHFFIEDIDKVIGEAFNKI
jgi:hypothetical protein